MEVEFNRAMGLLRGGDIDACIDVMKLLCFEMMDMLKGSDSGGQDSGGGGDAPGAMVRDLLVRRADELAGLMAEKTQQIFSEASCAIALGRPPNSRACKYALNCLMNIFSSPGLPAGVEQGTLHRLVRVLLLRLVDEHLVKVPEGEALLKALNVLMLKLLENCDRNASFAALLALLLEAPQGVAGEPELEARWSDLVVKCLIKITKALPSTIDAVDLRQLLFAIHSFFESLGVDEIRRRGGRDDKPLRMRV
ncbi:microtubule organization protein [Monoraphidium neglectum]|uniref:Microtubule organization protein n=1 Tax=Monoraphidium neglectum TaxID=145388 RepID=A0A0D2MB13_9CHLO|nr:microtubule organization protein [Monoraphidium neglectum]KIY92525.1 microtubule organization protein [Monoraphidium neglectum]|eukprot:XP_013891545.1 microtubule organization protein [Monoraphidium neglectum]